MSKREEVPVAESVDETSYSIRYDIEERSTVSDLLIPLALKEEPREGPASGLRLAEDLHARYSEGCLAPGMPPESFERSPAVLIYRFLLAPLAWEYLAGLSSLLRPRPALAKKLADELVGFCRRESVETVVVLPVGGLRVTRPISFGSVTVRPLTVHELGAYVHASESPAPRGPAFAGGSRIRVPLRWDVTLERVAIELRAARPKGQAPKPQLFLPKVVLAMQLLGYEPHGRGLTTSWTAPRSSSWSSLGRVPMNEQGNWQPFRRRDLQRTIDLAERIPDGAVMNPQKREEVSLHRFRSGVSETQPTEALMDLVIALESALLPGRDIQDLKYRFQVHGAVYIRNVGLNRRAVFDRLGDLYKLRSQLVHGSKPPSRDKLARGLPDARMFAQAALVRALTEGWPSGEELMELALA